MCLSFKYVVALLCSCLSYDNAADEAVEARLNAYVDMCLSQRICIYKFLYFLQVMALL